MAWKIMIQGTMSNAGKSLLCAGLCRIFKQDGYKVAPFKSQNMALNSFITDKGLEMGRAQVVQAEAAGIEPEVSMNPILLKPTNDVGSQVIVNGEVLGNMCARDYFAYKKQLIPDIMKAFHELEENYDIIVIEGAGSPAEINLKENDIVNMGLAKMVDAPVLLVGDIDRGGVTPYLHVEIEDEDSLTERFTSKKSGGLLDIAVIRTPRISNFTDFMALENIPEVSLRYVKNVSEFGTPDMIILPGTKNTMGDLKWIRESGLEACILKASASGTPVWGICGGYQMLGEVLCDPDQVEDGGTMQGMGLLPSETVFTGQKTRTRVNGTFAHVEGIFSELSNVAFEGYEIHMGETTYVEEVISKEHMSRIQDTVSGKISEDGISDGNVYGTYIHGIFDMEGVTDVIVKALAKKKGITLEKASGMDLKSFKEEQYDKLADGIRSHLDMERIYEIMKENVEEK